MATSIKYSEYFGFTEEETAELYERYVSLEETPHFDFESLRAVSYTHLPKKPGNAGGGKAGT